MTTATQRIAAGLARPQTEPVPLPDNIAEAPATVADLTNIASFAEAMARRFGKQVDEIEAELTKRAAHARERLSGLTAILPGQREQMVTEETRKAHRELRDASDKTRWEQLRELQAALARAEAAAVLFASPTTMLAREGLGTERRTHLQQQLAGAGPAELRAMALYAVTKKDRVLGAALLHVLDRMPRKDRQVSPHDLAARLMGEEHQQATAAIAVARNRFQESMSRNRAFESGKATGVDKVRAALNRRAEGDVLRDLINQGKED